MEDPKECFARSRINNNNNKDYYLLCNNPKTNNVRLRFGVCIIDSVEINDNCYCGFKGMKK